MAVIAESLAGKRIAVTGATGFLGTALVERLLRSVPDCEVVLLVRPGRRSTVGAAGAARDLPQRRLRPAARRAGGTAAFDDDRGPAAAGHRRRRRHRRPRPRRRRRAVLASCDIVIHSAATVSVRLAARRRRRGQPARPDAASPPPCSDLGVTPHLVAGVDVLRRRQPPRRRPRGAGVDRPVRPRRRLAGEVAAARRARTDAEAESRRRTCSTNSASAARHELGAAGTPAAGGQDRAAPRALGGRPHGGGRHRPRREPRLARRLRLHQGAGRAGPAWRTGRRAGDDRAAVDHRVGAGRAEARAGSAASAWPSR